MGLRSLEDGYTPPILDITQLDRKVLVSNSEAVLHAARAPERGGRLRGRLGRRGAGRRASRRGRDGGRERRRRLRRRRLEVPLGGHLHEAGGRARPRDGRARLVVIPAAVRDEIVAHARAGLPNEACGILAGAGDRVERFFPAEPDEPSPFYYRIESRDQIRIMNAIDDEGLDLRRHLPLARRLAGVSVPHGRRAGVLARGGLRDRVARGRRRRRAAAFASATWTWPKSRSRSSSVRPRPTAATSSSSIGIGVTGRPSNSVVSAITVLVRSTDSSARISQSTCSSARVDSARTLSSRLSSPAM